MYSVLQSCSRSLARQFGRPEVSAACALLEAAGQALDQDAAGQDLADKAARRLNARAASQQELAGVCPTGVMTPESPGWDPDPIFRKIIRKTIQGKGCFMHESHGVTKVTP